MPESTESAASPSGAAQRPFDCTVVYISDGTGITAETFGHSMMSQFERLRVRQVRLRGCAASAVPAHAPVPRLRRVLGRRASTGGRMNARAGTPAWPGVTGSRI